MTMSQTIEYLYKDIKLHDMIDTMTYYKNEIDLIKSELFIILLEKEFNNDIKWKECLTYNEQIYYCSSLLNSIRGNKSSYWKEFKNGGQPSSIKQISEIPDIIDDKEYNNKQKILDRISKILNTEFPWYESTMFRLYYLPFDDAHCEQKTYSLRELEKMHTYGEYKLTATYIHRKVKYIFNSIVCKLNEEGLLTNDELKYIEKIKLKGNWKNFTKDNNYDAHLKYHREYQSKPDRKEHRKEYYKKKNDRDNK